MKYKQDGWRDDKVVA